MAIFFYLFGFLLIFSGTMVITSRNPVYAVLWLILAFCNGSGLMVLIGAEFLAMMLIIIYVGAVSVLFLFVVMMLDIKIAEFKSVIGKEGLIAVIIAGVLFTDLTAVILMKNQVIPADNLQFALQAGTSDITAIGRLLYTEFILPFQTAGLVLFVAMVASIALVMRSRPGVKRQKISDQLQKNKENSLFIAENDGKTGLNNLNYDS